MLIRIRDCLKLIGITVVCFCAVFVCTFMLNFYLDVRTLAETVSDAYAQSLLRAQIAMAKLTAALAGGVLGIIAAIMLLFYVKLYVDDRARQLGILKAMGYTPSRLAIDFVLFGVAVAIGCLLGFGCGFAIMPYVYRTMTDGIADVSIGFHAELLCFLVVLPSILFSILSYLYAYCTLKRPVMDLLRGKTDATSKRVSDKKEKKRGFLWEFAMQAVSSKKSLPFFVAFACFCFSAMVQMGIAMKELSPGAESQPQLNTYVVVILFKNAIKLQYIVLNKYTNFKVSCFGLFRRIHFATTT